MGESAQTQQLIVARRGAYAARGSRLSRGGKSQPLEKQRNQSRKLSLLELRPASCIELYAHS
jgi:hypothetical protein